MTHDIAAHASPLSDPMGAVEPGQLPEPDLATTTPPASEPGRNLAATGLALGIVAWSVAILTLGMASFLSLALAMVGLPVSIIAMRRTQGTDLARGMATAGVAINGVGLALVTLSSVLFVVLGTVAVGMFPA